MGEAIILTKDKVRLLISDVGGEDGTTFLFSDKEIETFLAIEEQDVYMASATALRTIAGNEAQLLKAITVLELETDGAKVAKALKELAKDLETKSDEAYPFEIARMNVDMFSRRQLRLNQATSEADNGNQWESE